MTIKILILVLTFALSFPAWSSAEEDYKFNWISLINKELGPSCAFSITKIGLSSWGNNGFHSEQWFVQTCNGPAEYLVSYYPPASFPMRASPYEVKRVSPSSSVDMPNNSFNLDAIVPTVLWTP